MGTDTKECIWKKMRNDLFQYLVGMQNDGYSEDYVRRLKTEIIWLSL